jgi:ubiquinone/menaquinone biosynthesis C-methylase UbiE
MEEKLIAKYYDALSKIYDAETKKGNWVPNAESDKLLLPHLKKGSSVLDVGIGTGQSVEKMVEAGCKITGIDISHEMLEAAKSKFPMFELYQADVSSDLSLLNGKSYDAIVAIGVFEFVKNLQKVLKNLSIFLKPGGLMCFTYEEYLPDSELQKWKISPLGKGLIDPIPESVSFLVYRYTQSEIEHMLHHLNMTVLNHKFFVSYVKTDRKIPVCYGIVLARKK